MIVIAQRMGSALRADRVVLLDGSRCLVDTHAGLRYSLLYAELWPAGGCWQAAGSPRPSYIPHLLGSTTMNGPDEVN
ncbi:hypothetical protein [Streptomyces avermitilis]|uniref:hypothetical protein n=1 Tax=Streptomyces avermitilis TaxID=33903 RepID=UPI00381A992A